MARITLFTLIIVLGLCSLTAFANLKLSQSQEVQLFYDIFKDWNSKFNKQYGIEELAVRFMNWKSNYDFVQEYNTRHADSQLEMNDFASLSSEEFSALHLGLNADTNTLKNRKNNGAGFLLGNTEDANTTNETQLLGKPKAAFPKSVDWRKNNSVTAVKNQGTCGACWSFAAAGALEGLRAIKTKKLDSLSVQQMVDCSADYGNKGCDGGLMTFAYQYTVRNGIQLAADYNYTESVGECKINPKKVVFRHAGFTEVPSNNAHALKAAVTKQPVTVGIQANTMTVQLFKKGVIAADCGVELDHAVLIVGYDVTPKGQEYWIVKNSWGPKWGLNGYFNIATGYQNDGAGVCGINMMASYPTI